jgi:hypothetical protein
MAMTAGLIAFAADVDLQGLERTTRENLAFSLKFLLKKIRHSISTAAS